MTIVSESSPVREPASERALCTLFTRGGDSYALPVVEVHRVFVPGWINRLPRLPASVMGITQHRGRIVTVVDLAQLFGASASPERPPANVDARVLVLERAQRHLGLYVDAVGQIANLRLSGEPDERGLRLISYQGAAVAVLDAQRLAQRLIGLAGEEL